MCFVIHRILENGTTNVHSEKNKLDSIFLSKSLYNVQVSDLSENKCNGKFGRKEEGIIGASVEDFIFFW